jgi:hypothetical protein
MKRGAGTANGGSSHGARCAVNADTCQASVGATPLFMAAHSVGVRHHWPSNASEYDTFPKCSLRTRLSDWAG